MRKNIGHQVSLCTGRSYDRWGRVSRSTSTAHTLAAAAAYFSSIKRFLRDKTAQLDTFLKTTMCSLGALDYATNSPSSSQILGIANPFPYPPSARRINASFLFRDLERVDATRPHA
ncbi:hypothetical protein AB1N83_012736 [Pleurotus pulmonarius]